MVYDAANRMTASAQFIGATMTGAGTAYAWSVVKQDFDNNGNVVRRTSYRDALTTTSPTLSDADIGNMSAATASIVSYVYDSANRVIGTATTLGTVDRSTLSPSSHPASVNK